MLVRLALIIDTTVKSLTPLEYNDSSEGTVKFARGRWVRVGGGGGGENGGFC